MAFLQKERKQLLKSASYKRCHMILFKRHYGLDNKLLVKTYFDVYVAYSAILRQLVFHENVFWLFSFLLWKEMDKDESW